MNFLALLACEQGGEPSTMPSAGNLLSAGPVVCELSEGATRCATVARQQPYTTSRGLAGVNFLSISMSGSLVCGVDSAGSIQCEGFDHEGTLEPPGGAWSEVAAGNSHACALDIEGAPACWGADYDGATQAPALRLVNIIAGDNRTCAQDRESKDWHCWGSDTYWAEQGIILSVPPSGVTLKSPSMTGSALFGILADGSLAYYGYPDDPLGRDQLPEGTDFVRVDSGSRNACALRASGEIVCWGSNESGQTEVPAGIWVDVAAGDTHVCGRREGGDVWCWGCGDTCPETRPNIP